MKHFFMSLILLCSLWSISQASEAKVKVSLVSFSCILALAVACGIVICLNHQKPCAEGYKKAKNIAVNVKDTAMTKLENLTSTQENLSANILDSTKSILPSQTASSIFQLRNESEIVKNQTRLSLPINLVK